MKLNGIKKLILASKSPRRKDLLEQVGIPLEIHPSQVDEKKIAQEQPEEYATALSRMKARATARIFQDQWILGADTIVVIENSILGKPESQSHAMKMLSSLNGRMHKVYTAFCIHNQKQDIIRTQCIKTQVCFKTCRKEELEWYVKTGEPFGKAGGYAIQGKGAFLVESICGSYSNVVGLPVCQVIQQMEILNLIQF